MAQELPIPPQGEGAHNPEHPGHGSRPPTAGSEISFSRTTAELAAFRERPFSCREPSFMVPQDERQMTQWTETAKKIGVYGRMGIALWDPRGELIGAREKQYVSAEIGHRTRAPCWARNQANEAT